MSLIESIKVGFGRVRQSTPEYEPAHPNEQKRRKVAPEFAFVFPGQGSQGVGMGYDLYKNSARAKSVFDEADYALGFSLSKLCFEGPSEELRQTINAQPAILAMSIACLREAQASSEFMANNAPAFVAGHSLGEYTAMAAANAIKFADAIRLVRERGRLMQQAGQLQEGGMGAIIGLDETSIERICWETNTQVANINSKDQIVISGTKEALARAMDLGRAMGAKRIVPLDVSGAFHSILMRPAAEGMAIAISQTPVDDPESPVIANSDGSLVYTRDDVRLELNRHLCKPVKWKLCVARLGKLGVKHYVEIGPGNVLSGLIKRIDRKAQTTNIGNLDSARVAPLFLPNSS